MLNKCKCKRWNLINISPIIDNDLSSEQLFHISATWGANPFSSEYFVTFPRTAQDAINEGFHKISDCDSKCSIVHTCTCVQQNIEIEVEKVHGAWGHM